LLRRTNPLTYLSGRGSPPFLIQPWLRWWSGARGAIHVAGTRAL